MMRDRRVLVHWLVPGNMRRHDLVAIMFHCARK